MEIFVHYPKTDKDIKELGKRAAVVYAQAVTQYIEHLPCPKEQKLKLFDEIKKACRDER